MASFERAILGGDPAALFPQWDYRTFSNDRGKAKWLVFLIRTLDVAWELLRGVTVGGKFDVDTSVSPIDQRLSREAFRKHENAATRLRKERRDEIEDSNRKFAEGVYEGSLHLRILNRAVTSVAATSGTLLERRGEEVSNTWSRDRCASVEAQVRGRSTLIQFGGCRREIPGAMGPCLDHFVAVYPLCPPLPTPPVAKIGATRAKSQAIPV